MDQFANGYHELPPGKIAAVVTHLEMRRPSLSPPAAAPAGATLRRVAEPDPGWYRRLFREIGEDWLWFSRLQMDECDLAALLRDPMVEVFALEAGGREKGLLELDRREFPDIEIAFFGLTRDAIGKGLGAYLMSQALDLAWSHGPARVVVHTCTFDHPRALSFYLRFGFAPYKRSIEIADDPRLTGTLSRSAAPQVPLLP